MLSQPLPSVLVTLGDIRVSNIPSAILFNSPALPVDGVHSTLEEGGHGGQLVGQSPSCGECPPIIIIPKLDSN